MLLRFLLFLWELAVRLGRWPGCPVVRWRRARPRSQADLGSNPASRACQACGLSKLTSPRLRFSTCKTEVIGGPVPELRRLREGYTRRVGHSSWSPLGRPSELREQSLPLEQRYYCWSCYCHYCPTLATWQVVKLRPARSATPTGQGGTLTPEHPSPRPLSQPIWSPRAALMRRRGQLPA